MDAFIIPLSEAVRAYPERGFVIYSRVSSWGQAGRGKVDLEAKTDPVVDAVRAAAPGRLRRIVRAVEEGKLSRPRRKLIDAAEYAEERGCILVAADLSRFIRAESYDRRKNAEAWPTAEEFERLRELTRGVPLATVESPFLSESKRHSLATKRTKKAGRPRTIDDALAERIFADLGCRYLDDSECPWRWDRTLSEVARCHGVSTTAIVRAYERISPSGLTWIEVGVAKAVAQGLLEIDENGHFVSKLPVSRSRRGWYGKIGRPPKGYRGDLD